MVFRLPARNESKIRATAEALLASGTGDVPDLDTLDVLLELARERGLLDGVQFEREGLDAVSGQDAYVLRYELGFDPFLS